MRRRDMVIGERYAVATQTLPGAQDDLRWTAMEPVRLESVDTHAHVRPVSSECRYLSGSTNADHANRLYTFTHARVICTWEDFAASCATAERAQFGDDTAGFARLRDLRARHRALGLPGRVLMASSVRPEVQLRMDHHRLAAWMAGAPLRADLQAHMPDGWGLSGMYHADEWDDDTLDALIGGCETIAAAR